MNRRTAFRQNAAMIAVLITLIVLFAAIAMKASSRVSQTDARPAALVLKTGADNSSYMRNLRTLQNRVSNLARDLGKLKKALAGNYLKISRANAQFLRIGATAANSQAVGGTTADQLVHGKGQVFSAATTAQSGADTRLLGDGSVRVLVGLGAAAQPQITLANDTTSPITVTVTGGNTPSGTIPGDGEITVTPTSSQIDIQMFVVGGGRGEVWTATVSEAGSQFVGQMLVGSF